MNRIDSARMRAKLTVFGVALCITEGLAMVLLMVARLMSLSASTVEFGIFGAITTVLVSEWLEGDAQRAFAAADRAGFLNRNESRTGIRSVRHDCPKYWLVTLHLHLHPELVDRSAKVDAQ